MRLSSAELERSHVPQPSLLQIPPDPQRSTHRILASSLIHTNSGSHLQSQSDWEVWNSIGCFTNLVRYSGPVELLLIVAPASSLTLELADEDKIDYSPFWSIEARPRDIHTPLMSFLASGSHIQSLCLRSEDWNLTTLRLVADQTRSLRELKYHRRDLDAKSAEDVVCMLCEPLSLVID